MPASSFETPHARLLRMRAEAVFDDHTTCLPPKRIAGGLIDRPRWKDDAARLSGGGQGLPVKRVTGSLSIALAKMKRDLIECALLPRFSLRKPECFTLGIT